MTRWQVTAGQAKSFVPWLLCGSQRLLLPGDPVLAISAGREMVFSCDPAEGRCASVSGREVLRAEIERLRRMLANAEEV